MSLYDRFIKIEGLSNLPASQREALRVELDRLDRTVARVSAQDNGGGSRSAALDSLFVGKDLYVPAGVVKVGPDGAGNVVINTGGVKLNYAAVNKIWLQTDGDVLIGDDTSAPGKTYLSIFSTAQIYNSESVGAGDMLIGDNSSSKANILWDKSTGQLKFRGGTTTAILVDTSGRMTFLNNKSAVRFYDSTGSAIGAVINYSSSNDWGFTNFTAGGSFNFAVVLTDTSGPGLVWGEDSGQDNRTQLAVGGGVQGAKLTITDGSALDDTIIQTAGASGGTAFANFPGAVNVGNGTSTTAGELTVQNNIDMATGKFIGLSSSGGRLVFTDAATDTILVNNADFGIAVGSATQWAFTWNQTGTGSGQMYMPASTNKVHFQGGGNDNLTIDMGNRRVGIKNASPGVELDVTGTVNSTVAYQKSGTQVVGARVTGWAAATNTKSKATFDTTTVTLPNLAARVGQIIDDLIAHGLIGA